VNDHLHLDSGWHGLEEIPDQARWTSERATFTIAAAGATNLVISGLSYKPDLEREPARGHLEIDGRPIADFEIAAPGWQELRFDVAALAGPHLSAAIVVHNPWVPSGSLRTSVFEAVIGSPKGISGSRDTRTLGIVVRRIRVE